MKVIKDTPSGFSHLNNTSFGLAPSFYTAICNHQAAVPLFTTVESEQRESLYYIVQSQSRSDAAASTDYLLCGKEKSLPKMASRSLVNWHNFYSPEDMIGGEKRSIFCGKFQNTIKEKCSENNRTNNYLVRQKVRKTQEHAICQLKGNN